VTTLKRFEVYCIMTVLLKSSPSTCPLNRYLGTNVNDYPLTEALQNSILNFFLLYVAMIYSQGIN